LIVFTRKLQGSLGVTLTSLGSEGGKLVVPMLKNDSQIETIRYDLIPLLSP
jgi:hypothetical protein